MRAAASRWRTVADADAAATVADSLVPGIVHDREEAWQAVLSRPTLAAELVLQTADFDATVNADGDDLAGA